MPRGCKDRSGSTVELPVTPMLDMTFQLLFFFIVTFNPASAEGKLDFALPGAAAEGPENSTTLPPPVEIVVDSHLRLQLQTSPGGSITRIIVDELSGQQVFANLRELAAHFRHVRPARPVQQTDIVIQAEGNLKYACLVEVVDVCNKAGFKGVGFAPPR